MEKKAKLLDISAMRGVKLLSSLAKTQRRAFAALARGLRGCRQMELFCGQMHLFLA
jgi:hypothetical protein